MKRLIQSYRKGDLKFAEVPVPSARRGFLVVQTAASLVSVGTEKYMVEMARKSLFGKALARPDLVAQVIAKARAEGIAEAWRQAMGRLDTPVALGYSSSGTVLEVGEGVSGFQVGDRIACSGSGYSGHVQVAAIPSNLAVRIPKNVEFESAAFVALGGIALEAIRMAQVSLGESVAVIGLGLLGQIAIQLLKAGGIHVVGMDIDPGKVRLAGEAGIDQAVGDYPSLKTACDEMTRGEGADAVIILAAAKDNSPLEAAAEICRERGRVVAAGLVGLDIPRTPFYEKELELVVSRGWGPGLYDEEFTEKGLKYPHAYARWTAKSNMEEFLLKVGTGSVKLDHLISHRFTFENAMTAYELILGGKEEYLGVLLNYPDRAPLDKTISLREPGKAELAQQTRKGQLGVGLIGAGMFASGTLMPAMKGLSGVNFRGVVSAAGLNARAMADKYGFDYCSTDHQKVLTDQAVDLVMILTRHSQHARLVCESLAAGKHVFVEKPLSLTLEDLREIEKVYQSHRDQLLMVGFNRRFSPFSQWLRKRFEGIVEPLAVHCRANAGPVPRDHWVHDPKEGGGRIIGEVCHFVDLVHYFTGSVTRRAFAESLESGAYERSDNVVVTLSLENGSIGSVNYLAGGDKAFPRERIEVFGGGAVGVIDNFGRATFTRRGRKRKLRKWSSVDRGHAAQIERLFNCIQSHDSAPVPFKDYLASTLASLAIEESLVKRAPIQVDMETLAIAPV